MGVLLNPLNAPTAQVQHAIRHAGNRGVMRDHNRGGASLDLCSIWRYQRVLCRLSPLRSLRIANVLRPLPGLG